jgi:hypothetical protein
VSGGVSGSLAFQHGLVHVWPHPPRGEADVSLCGRQTYLPERATAPLDKEPICLDCFTKAGLV